MNKTLCAFTPADQPIYPPFFNVEQDGDEVVITVRAAATKREGVRVCGRTCTPGGEGCNNYCNHDRARPMADKPEGFTYHDAGATVSMRMPASEFAQLLKAAAAELA